MATLWSGNSMFSVTFLESVSSVGEGTAGKADALAGALCGHLVGLGIDDLILKGRRSCVDDQNVQVSPY